MRGKKESCSDQGWEIQPSPHQRHTHTYTQIQHTHTHIHSTYKHTTHPLCLLRLNPTKPWASQDGVGNRALWEGPSSWTAPKGSPGASEQGNARWALWKEGQGFGLLRPPYSHRQAGLLGTPVRTKRKKCCGSPVSLCLTFLWVLTSTCPSLPKRKLKEQGL